METQMSIVRMAALPGTIHPTQRKTSGVSKPAMSCAWQTLLTEAYPVIGLLLIVSYVTWVVLMGDTTLPWVGDLAHAE
jgi:hypothetical protein